MPHINFVISCMSKLAGILILSTLFSCGRPNYSEPHVLINTRLGDIELELFPQKAPKTVAAFLSYVDAGLYKNTSFYRVLKGEEMPTDNNTGIIQAGIYGSLSDKIGKIAPIPHAPANLPAPAVCSLPAAL